MNGHRKNFTKPHCVSTAITFVSAAAASLAASCSLSLQCTYILQKSQVKKGELDFAQSKFPSHGGSPWAVKAIVVGTRRLLKPSTRVPAGCPWTARVWLGPTPWRATATPKTCPKTINKGLKCKIGEFVITWSKQKSVWSSVAPGIMIFSKGGILAPESISKSAMVIMSCQLLFIDFLASFCHFFGTPYQFLYIKNHLE